MKILVIILLGCLCTVKVDAQTQFTYFNKVFGGDTSYMLSQVIQPVSGGYMVIGNYKNSDINYAIYVMNIDEQGDTLSFKSLVIGTEWGVVEDGSFVKPTSDGNFVCTIAEITYTPALRLIPHLFKFSSDGDTIWHQSYPNEYSQFTRSLIQTSDNGFAMAGYRYVQDTARFVLLKTDAEGNYEWSRTYMLDHDSRAFSVQQTPWDGGYIIGGWGYSTTNGYDMFVVKTLANGDTLWTKRYGGIYDDCAALVVPITTLEEFEAGMPIEYVLTACWKESSLMFDRRFYIAKLNETGNIIWSNKYNTYEAMPGLQTFPIVKSDKGIIGATGFTNSNGRKEAVVFSFKSNGTIEWSKTFTIDPQKDCYLKDLQPTPDGGYVLAGYQYSSPQTAWVLKIDSLGNTCSYVGCDSTVVVEVLPGITSNSSPEISAMVYPVPASTYLNIRYQIPSGILPSGNAGWYLYDITGRQVAETTLTGNNCIEEISVEHLPAGIYYYQVLLPLSGQVVASGKVVVGR
ncbi:MAG: T9SS type A sorting domain-containing protein [Sphingobacteriales bacterium]|nr:MAG: T9SS type A sorting domain-containing protein [Sphingobacteriales bacterium]